LFCRARARIGDSRLFFSDRLAIGK
jgi:hypothetical protein